MREEARMGAATYLQLRTTHTAENNTHMTNRFARPHTLVSPSVVAFARGG